MSLCSWLNWKWDVLIPFAAKSKGSFKVQRKKNGLKQSTVRSFHLGDLFSFSCASSLSSRGGCLGLVLALGCVGRAASSLMELQNNGGYFLHHVVFASFAVLSVLCIMLLPESKRKPLPDSMKDGENQRRPPLFLSQPTRDSLPLLHARAPLSEYNPDNYSLLVSATRKMLTKDSLPYRIGLPAHRPLLSNNETQEPETLRDVS